MTRIGILTDKLDAMIYRMTDYQSHRAMHNHLYGVGQAAALIALKRGENIELATMAGMLHDVGYVRMWDSINPIPPHSRDMHGKVCSDEARIILKSLGVLTDEEIDRICGAILVHDLKNQIDTPFDEVLKDADVLSHAMYDITTRNFRTYRWNDLKKEFGLNDI